MTEYSQEVGYFHLQKNPHHDLYDLSHQHLPRHFCIIVVVTAEVVVIVANVPGVAAVFDRNVTVGTLLFYFPYSLYCHVAVVNFFSS